MITTHCSFALTNAQVGEPGGSVSVGVTPGGRLHPLIGAGKNFHQIPQTGILVHCDNVAHLDINTGNAKQTHSVIADEVLAHDHAEVGGDHFIAVMVVCSVQRHKLVTLQVLESVLGRQCRLRRSVTRNLPQRSRPRPPTKSWTGL